MKSCAFIFLRFCIDIAFVMVRNFFTQRQANARSGKILFAVQPLEYGEYLVGILLVETDAVVLYNYFVV